MLQTPFMLDSIDFLSKPFVQSRRKKLNLLLFLLLLFNWRVYYSFNNKYTIMKY